MSIESQVLIIGAGAAGIAAACRLLEHGIQTVTILEAEDRIGGRVHTVQLADNVVELGAEWVHGACGNVSYELASGHDLLEASKNLEDRTKWIFVNSQGNFVPREQSYEMLTLYYKIYHQSPKELANSEGSYGEYFTKEYYKALETHPSIDQLMADEFLDWMHKFDSIEYSDSWFVTSGSGLAEYWLCAGDHFINWKDKGYKTLFDLLMHKFAGSAVDELPVLEKIHFKKVVSSIDYSDTNKIIIQTTDKSRYVTDHVIFTPSLGVLKEQHDTLFTPSLSELKRCTIQGLNIGTVNKIFFEFPKTWWPENIAGFNLIWSKEDRKEFIQSVGKENEWLGEVFHFTTNDYQPRVLAIWITGPTAKYVEGLTDDVVQAGLYNLLQKFLGGNYNISKPKNMMRSSWNSNKHFRGSYSFRSMESERLNVWAKDLAEPITDSSEKPVILFAGEATHEHYYSTVHGAVESGFREADRLIKYYR